MLPGPDFSGGRAVDRGLCLPPRHLRDPDQLDEQNVRYLHEGPQEGSLSRKHPGSLARAAFPIAVFLAGRRALSTRHSDCAISTTSAAAATGCAALENHGRKERVAVDEFTIEHILPQNEDLSSDWTSALGPEWERVQQSWLHTLGNLTLTGYNSEYSDRPFSEKRDMAGGFKESPLRLNASLGPLGQWNEEAIKVRAARLADMALGVWASPKLAAGIVAAYRPKPDRAERAASLYDRGSSALC